MKVPAGPLKIFLALALLSFLFVFAVLVKISSIMTPNVLVPLVIINGRAVDERKMVIDVKTVSNTSSSSLSGTVRSSNSSNSIVNSLNTDPPTTAATSSSSSFLFTDEGQSWKDPFCDEFLSNKFSVKMTPCDSDSNRVLCYGSPYDDKMGSCFIKNIAMDPVKFYSIMYTNRDSVETSNSLWLVRSEGEGNPCTKPVFDPMEKYMVGGDYVKRLAKTSVLSVPKSKCEKWINGTTFLFMGFDSHIYFKYLSWFSLHNGIINYETHTRKKPSLIIRIPQTKDVFTHADYEKNLFPETTIMSLGEFSAANTHTTCFEEVIITPWAYSTSAFRCKMADAISRLRNRCYNCNSRGLPGTRYLSFRRRAIAACSIEETYPDPVETKGSSPKKIVVEIRKPYMRHKEDSLNTFHRTLINPGSLLEGLRQGFPNATVESMMAEDLPLCDQIKMAHDADVLIGVHGAGMVHGWWLQDHALLFELVPRSQVSNPSFKMLSALTGKRYYDYGNVKGGEMEVIVDANDIVKELKKHY